MEQVVFIEATRISRKKIDVGTSIESSMSANELGEKLIHLLQRGKTWEVAQLLNFDCDLDELDDWEEDIEFEDIDVQVHDERDRSNNDLTESAKNTLPLFPDNV